MKKVLVASTNSEVIDTVKRVCEKYSIYFDPIFCPDTEEALSFIDYELPEIKILDFTSKNLDCNRILNTIDADPWLHNGGIIAIVSNAAMIQEFEEKKNPNILAVQILYTFKNYFDRLLGILENNKHFLFNRGLQETIGGVEKGTFVCANDPFDIRMYASFLVNYLYCTNRISVDGRYALLTTLMEMLTNALEHGNCGITYDEKSEWLEKGGNILDLIQDKLKDPVVGMRKIHIEYVIGKEKSQFTITDEGEGFDWRSRINQDFTMDMHGRGIFMSKSLVTSMAYNEKGNQVSFTIDNIMDMSNTVPLIMSTFSTVEYKKHEIVCLQNEPSNDLFFIVSGRYGVYVDGKLISVLTPKDIFIGEMAFLLNDRRSATIMSAGGGKLIRIPKVSFVNLIRKNPHYGIFLSKLLAQRVIQQNRKTISLTHEVEALREKL